MTTIIDTQQTPEEIIDSANWHEMTIMDLYKQQNILQKRYYFAADIGNISLMEQLNSGLKNIESIIKSKTTSGVVLI